MLGTAWPDQYVCETTVSVLENAEGHSRHSLVVGATRGRPLSSPAPRLSRPVDNDEQFSNMTRELHTLDDLE